jgi:hypothetical protein
MTGRHVWHQGHMRLNRHRLRVRESLTRAYKDLIVSQGMTFERVITVKSRRKTWQSTSPVREICSWPIIIITTNSPAQWKAEVRQTMTNCTAHVFLIIQVINNWIQRNIAVFTEASHIYTAYLSMIHFNINLLYMLKSLNLFLCVSGKTVLSFMLHVPSM